MNRKPTHTGKYLHFQSAHPIGHKRWVAKTLFTRAYALCLSPKKCHSEIKKVKQDLQGNGHPQQLIKTQERCGLPSSTVQRKNETEAKRASVPYASGVSEALSRIFKDYGVQIGHVPTSKLKQQLVRVKDPLDRSRYLGVVYKIPCQDCDAAYIGETRNFRRRLKEHENDVTNGRSIANALAEHSQSTIHTIHWQNASVITTENNL